MADFVPQKKSLPQVWPKGWSGPLPKNTHGLHMPTQQIPMTCCDVHLRNESRHAKVAKFHAAPIHWRGKPDRKTWRQPLHGAKSTVKRGTTWICFAKLRNFQANVKKNTNNLNISEIYWIFLNHCIALYGSLKIDLHGKFSSTCMS